jgi:hypothetical protein
MLNRGTCSLSSHTEAEVSGGLPIGKYVVIHILASTFITPRMSIGSFFIRGFLPFHSSDQSLFLHSRLCDGDFFSSAYCDRG